MPIKSDLLIRWPLFDEINMKKKWIESRHISYIYRGIDSRVPKIKIKIEIKKRMNEEDRNISVHLPTKVINTSQFSLQAFFENPQNEGRAKKPVRLSVSGEKKCVCVSSVSMCSRGRGQTDSNPFPLRSLHARFCLQLTSFWSAPTYLLVEANSAQLINEFIGPLTISGFTVLPLSRSILLLKSRINIS